MFFSSFLTMYLSKVTTVELVANASANLLFILSVNRMVSGNSRRLLPLVIVFVFQAINSKQPHLLCLLAQSFAPNLAILCLSLLKSDLRFPDPKDQFSKLPASWRWQWSSNLRFLVMGEFDIRINFRLLNLGFSTIFWSEITNFKSLF